MAHVPVSAPLLLLAQHRRHAHLIKPLLHVRHRPLRVPLVLVATQTVT